MRIYIAAPLFSEAEKQFNLQVDKFLRDQGFDTFLPQRDGYDKAQLYKVHPFEFVNKQIFLKDTNEIKNCDILLIILDGRSPDEGACVELGIAYTLGKKCVGLKTDSRSFMYNQDNPMILGCLDWKVASSFVELKRLLNKDIAQRSRQNL
jgi:nucleoside 2-deoxyribosyltransferase